jgi:hypothetical protein
VNTYIANAADAAARHCTRMSVGLSKGRPNAHSAHTGSCFPGGSSFFVKYFFVVSYPA